MVDIKKLTWDTWNVAHIALHNVIPEEVEEVCHSDPATGVAYGGRTMLIGPSSSGRMLAVILSPQPEPGVYYTVTARDADRKERQQYATEKGGGTP
jgi:uncharacterized DUF497 family protein